MSLSPADNRRRIIAGVSLIAAPVLLLTSSVLSTFFQMQYGWYLLAKLSFFFFAVAVLGLVHMLRGRADGSSLVGGALALAGCISGASIVTTYYVFGQLEGTVPAEKLQSLLLTIINSPLPGLCFPIGMLMLAVALWRKGVVPVWVGLLFALGAILFPVGRIFGIVWAVFACDIALTVSLGLIGLRVLGWTAEEWGRVPPATEEAAAA